MLASTMSLTLCRSLLVAKVSTSTSTLEVLICKCD